MISLDAWSVATVLTACGIETINGNKEELSTFIITLQQCLPLAVLKPSNRILYAPFLLNMLQQCLPLAVLKQKERDAAVAGYNGCNSAYRLRY